MSQATFTLKMASTSYTVALPEHQLWIEHVAWGVHGIEDAPSTLARDQPTSYHADADTAPVEYAPYGMRAFSGADLVAGRVGAERESYWRYDPTQAVLSDGEMRFGFLDDLIGLRTVLCYATVPDTDVVLRWAELTTTANVDVRLERFDSAGFCLPTGKSGARLVYLRGRWAQEFQLTTMFLPAGRFEIGGTRGIPGHDFAPWLAIQDASETSAPSQRPTWGVSLAWPGSWRIDTDIEQGGFTRVRAGRLPHESAVLLAPGQMLRTPDVAAAFSPAGLDGLAGVWHDYERALAGSRLHRRRPVLYNSWEATGFAVHERDQLELAALAADMGAELFVVDDGWFTGRDDDTGGLGDWHPDPGKFPNGFAAFIDSVRALGLEFGLWIEPEAMSPRSRLYRDHPEWAYHIEGRPATLIRNQLLLDLGRDDVYEFVLSTLLRLLDDYPISYLKWDINRPATERGRPGGGPPESLDLDGAHATNYLRVLDELRSAHPEVSIEGCAGGGGRTDLASVARVDVLWPSDNTAPLDRLSIQFGFLHAHAPHLMSSWVTDAKGMFDARPRSLRFRFLLAMAGVLGIGADIRTWTPAQRAEAAAYVALYKRIRDTIHYGTAHLLGTPSDPVCAIEYIAEDRRQVVVLAWRSGALDSPSVPPTAPEQLPLRGLDQKAEYRDEFTGVRYAASQLISTGLVLPTARDADAHVVVLDRSKARHAG